VRSTNAHTHALARADSPPAQLQQCGNLPAGRPDGASEATGEGKGILLGPFAARVFELDAEIRTLIGTRDGLSAQVVGDIRALWKSDWVDRGKKTANFGELRETDDMPAVLIEIAFHDTRTPDNDFLHEDEFRRDVARALAKGIAAFLNVPESTVYGVSTFYAQFKLTPLGRKIVKICRGTACHVRGGAKILEEVEKQLGIKAGETTDDLEYTLETIACFGSCALAPVMVIDDVVHGRVTTSKVKSIIAGTE